MCQSALRLITCHRESSVTCQSALRSQLTADSDTVLRSKRPESSPQMCILEMSVYLPDDNLSLTGGGDMSVLKFQVWCCGDVTSVVGRRHESGMGSDWFNWKESAVLSLCCEMWTVTVLKTYSVLSSLLTKASGPKISLSPFSSLKFFHFQACLQNCSKRQL
jgi:hypothetical protein